MAIDVHCTNCDDKGEHWHWEGTPFASRAYRGPCDTCGGLKWWTMVTPGDWSAEIATWGWGRCLREGSRLYFDLTFYRPQQSFERAAMLECINSRLRYHFKMSDLARFFWYRRIHLRRRALEQFHE